MIWRREQRLYKVKVLGEHTIKAVHFRGCDSVALQKTIEKGRALVQKVE
jgi:hypothetical protein